MKFSALENVKVKGGWEEKWKAVVVAHYRDLLLSKLKCAKDKDIYPKEMDNFQKIVELGTLSYLELCGKVTN